MTAGDDRILGAVLAGGASSRFGSDKALHMWRGQPLLAHALAALRPMSDALLIAGRQPVAGIDIAAVPDRPAPGLGPLGGLAAALHHAAAHGFARVLTAGCDTPRIPPETLRALLDRPAAAVLAGLPIIAIWPASLSPRLDSYLAATTDPRARSIRAFAQAAGAEFLDLPVPPNLNRPSDLSALEAPS